MDILSSAKRTIQYEQQGLQALDITLGSDYEAAVSLLLSVTGRVITSGIGKSGHIANKTAATFSSTGTASQYVHPVEASHGDLGMITTKDILLIFSWSGATSELVNILTYAKRFSIPIIAITSEKESILGKSADICLTLPKVTEACPHGLAPTTSTTMQLVLGDSLAVNLLEQRGFTSENFKDFHPGGKLGADLKLIADIMHTEEKIPLIDSHTVMSHALIVMTEKGFGCLGVINTQGILIGIITDGDLRRHMNHDFLSQKASEIMSESPTHINSSTFASAALLLMNEKKIQSLFVCEDNKPIGFIHLHDLLRLGVA